MSEIIKDGLGTEIKIRMTQTLESVAEKVQEIAPAFTSLRDLFPVTQEMADLESPSRNEKTTQFFASEAKEVDDYSDDWGTTSSRSHNYTQGHKRCGDAYDYGYFEVYDAARKGYDLDSSFGQIAKTSIVLKESEWGINGTRDGAIKGLTQIPGVINFQSTSWRGLDYQMILGEAKKILNQLSASSKLNMTLPSDLIRDLKTCYIDAIRSNVFTELTETLGLNIVSNDGLDQLGIHLVYPDNGIKLVCDQDITQMEPELVNGRYKIKVYTKFGGVRVSTYGSVAVIGGLGKVI
jgi:hypothetical protein